MIKDDATLEYFALNDFFLNAAAQSNDIELLLNLYNVRVTKQPTVAQNWSSLAFLYKQIGDNTKAAELLREAAKQVPSFAKAATCIADNIEAQKANPEEGC